MKNPTASIGPLATVALGAQRATAQASPPPSSSGPPILVPLLTPLVVGAVALVVWRLFFPNCRPNQILVIAGRRHRRGDGQTVGYRVINGGRAFALPLLERCSRMDVRVVPVALQVEKAYAKGGTPIDVEAIASVKIDTDPALVGNAIERFLERDPKELVEVSRQTLEGHLRTMVAALSPEQVNEDRLRFAHEVTEVVQPEMGKLGLRLDTFKILRVSDQVEYYDSLGRARLAEVLRDAAIAEAEGFADADQREAEAQQRAEVAGTEANAIFLMQQVETILAEAAQLAGQLELGHIDVLESGSPASLAELVTLYPAVMRGFLDSVRDLLGIDVLSALTLPPSQP